MRKSHKVYIFFNGPSLGGAERSFSLQAKTLQDFKPDYQIHFFIPYIDSPDEAITLKDFIVTQGFRSSQISYYRYSKALYQLSRGTGFEVFLWVFKVIYGLLITVKNLSKLDIKKPDIWWVGGNKVGFVVFLLGIISGFDGRFLWHFRDYPYGKGFYKIIWKIFKIPHRFSLEAIGNSFDVCRTLKEFDNFFKKIHVLYNPLGKIPFSTRENVRFIGTASMMAPWKGVHSLVFFALLYEKKLKGLGYEKFLIFGDEIYKTKGTHIGYLGQLKKLVSKYNSDFVEFKGMAKPQDIFSHLDTFIHGSLKPEPFGRVVGEAYLGGAALISTGLGGSGELVDNGVSGLTFGPYDYKGLYEKVKTLSGDERFNYIQQGKYKAQSLDKLYHQQIVEIF